MRIFAAGIETETNTFAPWPTGASGFAADTFHGDALTKSASTPGQLTRLYQSLAQTGSAEVVGGLFAYAEPSGPTLQRVFEDFCAEIVGQIVREGHFDVILLLLHGAMVATDCDDCEGDLLERVRSQVGTDSIIGAVLDPHCHMTDRMVANADVLICCKYYPHDDYVDRASELFDLCVRAKRGEIRPVSAVFDCRMIGGYPTTEQPMAGFVERLKLVEREPGILSVSLVHGFPWGDTFDTGSKMLVVADDDEALARDRAEALGLEFYEMRERLKLRLPSISDALDEAQRLDSLVVLAEMGDNPGGGAPGDNTALLRAMIERGVTDAAVGCFWDPMVALTCADAGEGAELDIRLGGKCGPSSGAPLDLRVRVQAVREGYSQTAFPGTTMNMGLTVWLQHGGIAILANAVRSQVFHPDLFTGLGLDLSKMRYVAVKSSQHFRTGFDPIADHVIRVATPGALNLDYATVPYAKRRPVPYYPKVLDPLGDR
jgi:microcystin degradation protein MlrC